MFPTVRISRLTFVLFLSHVPRYTPSSQNEPLARRGLTEPNPAHAMRPCRQHLLLNKLLITKNVRRPLMNMLND